MIPLALAFLALLPLAFAGLFNPKGAVTVLSSSSFQREVLDIEKPTMVAFVAPWCGHCQRLTPEYERAAATLDGVVKLAAIDCDADENKPVCGRYGIQGFPTLKLFPPTKKRLPKDYQGPRTAKDISAFAVDALPASAKKLKAEELQEYVGKSPARPKVLLFSTKPTSSALYKSLALDFRTSMDFAFLRGDQSPVASAALDTLGLDLSTASLPTLVVLRSGEGSAAERMVRYDGKLKYKDLHSFLQPLAPKSSSGEKTKSAKKANKSGKKSSTGSDSELPNGAAYEWKAQKMGGKPVSSGQASKERVSEAAKAAQDAIEKAKKKARGAEGHARQMVFGTSASRVGHAASGAAESVRSGASVASKSASSAASSVSASATPTTSSSDDDVQPGLLDLAADAALSVGASALHAAASVLSAGSSVASDAAPTASSVVDSVGVGETAGQGAQIVAEKVADALGAAAGGIKAGAEKFEELVEGVKPHDEL